MALRIFLLNAAGAINSASLFSSGVVDAAAIAAGAVGSSEIATDAVGADEIAADAVGSAEIAANAVADSELDTTVGYNFTGAIQKDGVAIAPGDLYYCVVVASTSDNIANLAAGAPNTLNGVSLNTNDDVLVWGQSTASQNGIYNVDSTGSGSNGAWTRAAERNETTELPVGLVVYDKQRQIMYRLASFGGTVGTDAQTWEEVQEGLTPAGSEPAVVGTGDGSDLRFDLITTNGNFAYVAIFVDGIQQAGSVYSISLGTGTGGVDELVFGSGNAPANGAVVEMLAMLRA